MITRLTPADLQAAFQPAIFGEPISCKYNNDAFLIGKDNGVAAAVFAREVGGFDKCAAIQFCERPDGTSYILLTERGPVTRGIPARIVDPPQEVLKTRVDPVTGETVYDINMGQLSRENPKWTMQLRKSRDGQSLTVLERGEKVAELKLTWSKKS